MSLRVAVVGAGPAGIYASDMLIRNEEHDIHVDLFDEREVRGLLYRQLHALRDPSAQTHERLAHLALGIEMAPHMPTNPENMGRTIVNDIEWWADNQDEVEATFQNWLAQ